LFFVDKTPLKSIVIRQKNSILYPVKDQKIMFKMTPENPQFDLFSTPSTQMGKREAKKIITPES
jgi:hypothetical protein